MEYTKPFLTFEEQAEKLIARGLLCDQNNLIEHLNDVGYYRLSGYWYIYLNRKTDNFRKDTSFNDVWDDYVFDRQFRLLVLDAVERVEIYFRTQLAHLLARETGVFGYMQPAGLPRLDKSRYEHFMQKCREKHSESREPFAIHFRDKYGDKHELPPYWVLVNMMDFGQMLTLYRGAPVSIRNEIADVLELPAKVVESWLRSLNTVRNVCAHHGRLWNKDLGVKPMIPRNDKRWSDPCEIKPVKVFSILTILSYLLKYIAPDTSWRNRLFTLIESRNKRELERMGFPNGWKECVFWKPYIDKCE